MSTLTKAWQTASNMLNPLSSETDHICSTIYKRITDSNGHIQEKIVKLCELLHIDTDDILEK